MRRLLLAIPMAGLALALPAAAFAQHGNLQLQAFGGLTMRDINPSTTFGGSLAVPLTDNIQVIGEGGRMTDVMAGTLSLLLDITPVDLRLSAYYGEGGIRILADSDRAVRPYAEATAGLARTRAKFTGIGPGPDAGINAALQLLDTTRPMLGLGGGIVVQGGPLLVDLGYRYHKLSAGNALQSALTFGDLNVHQVRVGVGVRF